MSYSRRRKVTHYTALMIACVAAVLLILHGCTDLTEFDHVLRAGIKIINTPDLSVTHTIENIPGARSLCSLPDCFIVATMEGTLICFDLESYQQTGSFSIGSPSSSGYFEMEYSPLESSVYIIGVLGQIVEMHVPDMEIMDTFSVCETPVDIEVASEKPYFYVASSNSCRIYEVRQENNIVSRSCALPSSPTCMATIKSYFAPPLYSGSAALDGDIHYMCTDSAGNYTYVLSYLGDNTSRLVSYNCIGYSIENQIDLQGYPLDLEMYPGSTLLVLTAD